MVKRTEGTENWGTFDTARDPYNLTGHRLHPSTNDAESVSSSGGWTLDLLSNGFKWRGTNNATSAAGEVYIYIAFAETPFKYANAR